MKDYFRLDKKELFDSDDIEEVFLAISGFIVFMICCVYCAVYISKHDFSIIDTRFTSNLFAVSFINLCSAYICIDWEEGFITKLVKYIAAISILVQTLLILLCENEWKMTFVRVMIVNIIGYIPFVLSFMNRLLDINKTKSPIVELLGVAILSCMIFLNHCMHLNRLTALSVLSLLTLIPNAIIQIYYYLKRRSPRNE